MKKKPLTELQAWGEHEFVVTAAVRYALGRRTYLVGMCCDWLIGNWERFDQPTRSIIIADVEDQFRRGDMGDECDRKDWERVRALWTTNCRV